MTPPLSNTTITNIHTQVRTAALESFEFFANTVLGSQISDDVCKQTQELLEGEKNGFISARRPRALTVAVLVWLNSKGVAVLTTVPLPQHEILHWLELGSEPVEKTNRGVVLDVQENGVGVQWV